MHSNVIQGHFPAGLSRAGSVKSQLHGAAVQLAPHLLRSSAGQPLPPAVRQKMESLFGTSFAEVRVHVGPHVTSIGAQAFTHGNDIHFAAGQYDPVSPAGARMLARQLAHVVQQRAGKVRNPYGTGIAIVQDRLLDAEAERMSRRVAQRYVVVPSDRVFTKLGRFPRRVSPNRPMVLRETAVFPAQERDRRRGYLRTDGSANVVNKNDPGLRVSDDGQMAIENSDLSNRQPKSVYLSGTVLTAASRALRSAGSRVELVRTGRTLRVYQSHTQFVQLSEVVPRLAGARTRPSYEMLAPQNCQDMGGFVTGRKADSGMVQSVAVGGNRRSVMDEVHLAVADYIAVRLATRKADHLADLAGIPDVSDDPLGDMREKADIINRIARDYVKALRSAQVDVLQRELRALGINQYANPNVGEAFVIHSTAGEDDQGHIVDLASRRRFVPSWPYHFGGVVAKSGNDYVTLENYARGAIGEEIANPGSDPRWYFQMYSGKEGQSFHEANVALGGYANAVTMRLVHGPQPNRAARAWRRMSKWQKVAASVTVPAVGALLVYVVNQGLRQYGYGYG